MFSVAHLTADRTPMSRASLALLQFTTPTARAKHYITGHKKSDPGIQFQLPSLYQKPIDMVRPSLNLCGVANTFLIISHAFKLRFTSVGNRVS